METTTSTTFGIEHIAIVAHETNRAYCQQCGDNSQLPWDEAPQWQRESAIKGVQFHIDNPEAGCSGSHENWLKVKEAEKKEHPCFVPYEELLEAQKVKDALFVGVVRALKVLL